MNNAEVAAIRKRVRSMMIAAAPEAARGLVSMMDSKSPKIRKLARKAVMQVRTGKCESGK